MAEVTKDKAGRFKKGVAQPGAGAPKGNQNAARGAQFKSALMRMLALKYGSTENGLDQVALKLIQLGVESGWLPALQEIANRFDGKPHQSVTLVEDDDKPVAMDIKEVAKRLAFILRAGAAKAEAEETAQANPQELH